MAPRTPRLTELSDLLGQAYRLALDLVTAQRRLTVVERQLLWLLLRALHEAREADQQRRETLYALDHGLPEPLTPWHARQRREMREQAKLERTELLRLIGEDREAA